MIFNQGNTPDCEGLIVGTLAPSTPGIPVVGASFADGAALAQAGSTAHVRVLPSETRTDVNVIAELPGLKKSDIDIQVKGNTIRIAGARSVTYPDKVGVHRRERLAGRFDRAINVPVQIDADRVKAEYRDGILALHLPRAEADKPRSIKLA